MGGRGAALAEVGLTSPATPEDLAGLAPGNVVYLAGCVYTAREGVCRKVPEEGAPLPDSLATVSNANFHCSPAAARAPDGTFNVGGWPPPRASASRSGCRAGSRRPAPRWSSARADRLVVKNRYRFPSPFGNRIWRAHRSTVAPSSAKSCQPLSSRRLCLSRALCNRSTFRPRISMVRFTRLTVTPTCLQALLSASIRPLARTRRSDGRAGSDLGSMKSGSVLSPFAWPQLSTGNRSLSVRIAASSDVPPLQQAIMLVASKVRACPYRG